MNNSTKNSLNCKKNKSREVKRRYQCKNISRKKSKMFDEEVDTDFKVKQFLADVQKSSEQTQKKNEERSVKLKASNMNQEKRGLFENGMLSKPSVKGILGHKNKARLTGNLESLLEQGDKSTPISSDEDSSFGLNDSINDIDASGMVEVNMTDNPEKPSTSKQQCSVSLDTRCDFSGDTRILKHKKPKSSNITESDKSELQEIVNKKKNEFDSVREDILQRCRKEYINLLQKNFLENALKNEDELLKSFKNICHEYILSQKVKMVDKCEQTDIVDSVRPKQKSNVSNISSDNIELPPSKMYHFFDSKNKKFEEPFSFQPRQEDIENSSLNINVPFGKKESLIETPQIFKTNNMPSILKENEKPYIPTILSPLSPGRKYASFSPENISNINNSFLWSDKKQSHLKMKTDHPFIQPLKKQPFQNFIQPTPPRSKTIPMGHSRFPDKNLLAQQSFPAVTQEEPFNSNSFIETSRKRLHNSFIDFGRTKDLMSFSGNASSAQSKFPCPKKTKMLFSPHRL